MLRSVNNGAGVAVLTARLVSNSVRQYRRQEAREFERAEKFLANT